ncbi:MAG: hypothetical protein K0S51_1611 [Bacillales bacterium]|jgi:RNA polymerase subunit RPABC4/transcription elongation factor Spt4|nr:hypothetical protein [Bacillales bacterium]
MKYTCKKCCTIINDKKACPVCKQEDHLMPIIINVQGSSYGFYTFDFEVD